MMPSSPSATACTAAASVTIENTISAPLAAARGESAHRMPDLISGSALSWLRFQPVTVCPAAISRGTMPAPMAPSPTNPMFIHSPRGGSLHHDLHLVAGVHPFAGRQPVEDAESLHRAIGDHHPARQPLDRVAGPGGHHPQVQGLGRLALGQGHAAEAGDRIAERAIDLRAGAL